MLPASILNKASQAITKLNNTGISILEISHRSDDFKEIAEKSKKNLKDLLKIPDNYEVLFLQGGARTQFSMLAMNYLSKFKRAHYWISGFWSQLAANEAKKILAVASTDLLKEKSPQELKDKNLWDLPKDCDYLHITNNETIDGIEYYELPEDIKIPIIADMSSTLLSRPFDINPYSLIYACAQKNLGCAGVTWVLVKKDTYDSNAAKKLPMMLSYEKHIEQNSLLNTSPTFAVYLSNLVFEWIKEEGGLEEMAIRNKKKSDLLYEFIDQSHFYHCPVSFKNRSQTNVCFFLKNKHLNEKFIEFSQHAGLLNLKGHKIKGGFRASLYNAMPLAGVERLANVMDDFSKQE